jgi:hypothetical protein
MLLQMHKFCIDERGYASRIILYMILHSEIPDMYLGLPARREMHHLERECDIQ